MGKCVGFIIFKNTDYYLVVDKGRSNEFSLITNKIKKANPNLTRDVFCKGQNLIRIDISKDGC